MGFIEETNQIYGEAGGHLCDTDQELYLAHLDKNTAEQQRLTKKIYAEFWTTPTGAKLKSYSKDHDATAKRLMEVFTQRYGDSPLYIFRLADCAKDLLNAEYSEPVVNLDFDPPEPSDAQKRAALVAQIKRDMEDPRVPSSVITERRRSSVAYERAFQDANTPEATTPKPEAPSEAVKFAHMLNAHVREVGIPKLNGGFYTITAGGKGYRYPAAKFNELYEAAAQSGLLE